MKNLLSFFFLCFLMLNLSGCRKDDGCVTPPSDAVALQGNWKLTNVKMGDIAGSPCLGGSIPRAVTINFTAESAPKPDEGLIFRGQSVVNEYAGSYKVLTFDTEKQVGTIKMSEISTTKKAGTAEEMQCESLYYSLLKNSDRFVFVQNNGKMQLLLGIAQTLPGGVWTTYMTFEKTN